MGFILSHHFLSSIPYRPVHLVQSLDSISERVGTRTLVYLLVSPISVISAARSATLSATTSVPRVTFDFKVGATSGGPPLPTALPILVVLIMVAATTAATVGTMASLPVPFTLFLTFSLALTLTLPLGIPILLPHLPDDALIASELLDVIGHAGDDELLAEETPGAAGAVPHRVRELHAVPLPVRPLNRRHVVPVPVEPHQAASQQVAAETVAVLARAPRLLERMM